MVILDDQWLEDKIFPHLNSITPIKNDSLHVSPGDIWSIKKELFIYEYIKPFHQILRKQNKKLHYYDPFCGTGLIGMEAFGYNIKFPGSPIITLSNDFKFDSYHFSDSNGDFLNSLQQRTNILFPNDELNFIKSEFVESTSFLDTLDQSKDGVLAIIDPADYKSIPWKSVLNVLKYPTLDALITLTAQGMTRNFSEEYQNNNSLREFLGVDKNYEFNNIDQVLNTYAQGIQKMTGKGVLPLKIQTKNNHYYVIFAVSRSVGGLNVLKYLRDKLDRISNDDLIRVIGKLSKNIRTMDDYF